MKNNPNFITPVGPASSGKDFLVDALIARGYERISLSDSIREDLDVLYPGRKHLRKDLQDWGDQKRKEFGNDYWAKRAGEKIREMIADGKTKFVINSIRNPAELTWFKKNFGLIVIAVDAPLELRIKWAIRRARDIDEDRSEEDIRRDFKRDLGIGQPEYGQNVKSVLAMSDLSIINDEDGNIKGLKEKIENALISLGVEGNPNHQEKK